MRVISVALMCVASAGCSFSSDTKAAAQQTEVFYQRLNAGTFDEIYADTSPGLKKATTADQFRSLLGAVHRKLGIHRAGRQEGWSVNATTGGTFTRLTYASTYDRGPATETFVYLTTQGARPVLNGYNINSMAMMIE